MFIYNLNNGSGFSVGDFFLRRLHVVVVVGGGRAVRVAGSGSGSSVGGVGQRCPIVLQGVRVIHNVHCSRV